MRYAIACAALIAGCTTIAPAPSPAPASENLAVAELVRGARTHAGTGRLAEAAAALERAIRIEPRNPRLWHELAGLRLKQGDYVQAESVAERSNFWAGGDERLRTENWRLIAEARAARGDAAAAAAARERASRTGR
jgi:Tfp pilus assembly protein PilF